MRCTPVCRVGDSDRASGQGLQAFEVAGLLAWRQCAEIRAPDRLGQTVVKPCIQVAGDVFGQHVGGDSDQLGQRAVSVLRAQCACDLISGDVWHAYIDEERVNPLRLGRLQGSFTIGGADHFSAHTLQHAGEY